VDEASERDVIAGFGSANWTDGMWGWRLGILNAWLSATGQVKVQRGKGLVRRAAN